MLQFEIITPEKVVYKDEVDEVLLPTPNGEIGILPEHISLVSQVSSGEITLKKKNKENHVAVTGGYVQVENDKVTILADYAIRSDDIELKKAEEAKQRAEKKMKEKVSERDFALAESELRRSLLEIQVVKRRRASKIPGQ